MKKRKGSDHHSYLEYLVVPLTDVFIDPQNGQILVLEANVTRDPLVLPREEAERVQPVAQRHKDQVLTGDEVLGGDIRRVAQCEELTLQEDYDWTEPAFVFAEKIIQRRFKDFWMFNALIAVCHSFDGGLFSSDKQ